MAEPTEQPEWSPGSFADDLLPEPAATVEGEAKAEPSQPEAEAGELSEETKQAEGKVETKADETPTDTKAEEGDTARAEESKEATPAPTDWESGDNPYKQRHADTFKWGNNLNQQLAQLSKQLQIQGKKIDGTYDEAVDGKPEFSPEQMTAMSELNGKIAASDSMAYSDPKYGGRVKVDQEMEQFNAIYGKHDAVQRRVLLSPTPTLEALTVMKEHRFFTEYGRDPEAILAAISTKEEARLRPILTKEIEKKYLGRLKAKEENVEGLNGVRPSTVQEKAQPSNDSLLEDTFTNF